MLAATVLHAGFRWAQGRTNWALLGILAICTTTELLLVALTVHHIPNGPLVTASIVCHDTLWLWLLGSVFEIGYARNAIVLFLFAALGNCLFYEGHLHFNYVTFLIGAFLYVIIFIWESVKLLRIESLEFLTSNRYILLCAPLFFFLALSFVFGFRSEVLSNYPIFMKFSVYHILILLANISYYGIINLYLIRTKNP